MSNSSEPTNPNKFGLGQMMLIVAWVGLVFGLIRTTLNTRPPTYGRYSAIAVSDTGNYLAAVYYDGIHLFREGNYVNSFKVGGRVNSLKYIDKDTLALAIANVNSALADGVHFYSLKEKRITRSIPVEPDSSTTIRLLDDKFIVHVDDHFDVYDMDAQAGSGPSSSYSIPVPAGLPFAASNDGRFVVFHAISTALADSFDSQDSDERFVDYDLETGKSKNSLTRPNGLAFSLDGSFVITSRNEIEKLSWPSAEKQWSVPIDRVSGRVRISPDGGRFAVLTGRDYADEERYLRVYDSLSGTKLFETELNEMHGVGYTFSPDGQTVWTSDRDAEGVLLQWDIASSSIANRVGTNREIQYVLFYTTLLFLWSVLYSKLFPSRVHSKKRRVVYAGFLLLGSIVAIASNCSLCFLDRSMMWIAPGLLFSATWVAVTLCRTAFGFAKKPPEQQID